jgi:hypothetical protein
LVTAFHAPPYSRSLYQLSYRGINEYKTDKMRSKITLNYIVPMHYPYLNNFVKSRFLKGLPREKSQ